MSVGTLLELLLIWGGVAYTAQLLIHLAGPYEIGLRWRNFWGIRYAAQLDNNRAVVPMKELVAAAQKNTLSSYLPVYATSEVGRAFLCIWCGSLWVSLVWHALYVVLGGEFSSPIVFFGAAMTGAIVSVLVDRMT